MGSFVKESWLMVVVSIVAGLAVAGVYSVEKPRIDQNGRDFLNRSVLAVVPGGQTVEPTNLAGIHKVLDASGRLAGWGVQADGAGFQGTIRLVIGLDPRGQTVTGVEVLEMSETPGLGARITEPQWRAQFAGKPATTPLEVVKTEPSRPQHVHAITAATISSKAVVTIVNDKVAKVKDQLAKEAGL